MPNGDTISQGPSPFVGPARSTYLMLDSQAADTNGVWILLEYFRNFSLEVLGLGTATIQLYGDNGAQEPSATGGVAIGSAITANGMTAFSIPVRWVRVAISGYSAGTISAILHASLP